MKLKIPNSIIIIALIVILLSIIYIDLFKYKKLNQKKVKEKLDMVPYKGKVVILNGCGKSGIANSFSKILRKKGYKVYITDNAKYWNYRKTEVLSLDGNMDFANKLAKNISCEYVFPYKIDNSFYNIRVIIGKDYNKYLKQWSKNNEL